MSTETTAVSGMGYGASRTLEASLLSSPKCFILRKEVSACRAIPSERIEGWQNKIVVAHQQSVFRLFALSETAARAQQVCDLFCKRLVYQRAGTSRHFNCDGVLYGVLFYATKGGIFSFSYWTGLQRESQADRRCEPLSLLSNNELNKCRELQLIWPAACNCQLLGSRPSMR